MTARNTTSGTPSGAGTPSVRPRPGPVTQARVRLTGLAMCAAAGFAIIAALSHNPLDPALDVAAPGPVVNLMGAPGAVFADLMLQTTGWAGPAACLAVLAWGLIFLVRGARGRPAHLGVFRFAAGLAGAAGFAIATAALPMPAGWPFAAGLGGLLGDHALAGLSGLLAMTGLPFTGVIAAAAGLTLAVTGVFFCFGLRLTDLAAASDAASMAWATARVWIDQLIGAAPRPWRRFDETGPAPRDGRAETAPDFIRPGGGRPASAKSSRSGPVNPAVKVAPRRQAKPSGREDKETQPGLPLEGEEGFVLPRLGLLAPAPPAGEAVDPDALMQNAELLVSVLADFGVKGEVVQVRPGPVVTLYELEPAPGVKSSRIINLADDIARSMAAVACRVAVVPGRNAIGIELPNQRRETVFLRTLLASAGFEKAKAELPLALGQTIGGEPFTADLARMPHLLIAGTTGSGKSVGINAIILSLLYRLAPEECRMIMIDPKQLELSIYNGIPHLLSPVVTDPKKAVTALKWTVREMESRYNKMSKVGVRSMAGFNEKAAAARKAGNMLERTVQTGFDRETGQPVYETESIEPAHLPYIVVVIDEMADLMMVAGKEIEGAVQRLAQMARAAGIHLVMATQRPSVDVITGTIKANFPTRISYQVTSKIDSRTILGEQGAEQLLGQGDLLYMANGGRIKRLHGPFVSDREVEDVAAFLKAQGSPEYLEAVTQDHDEDGADSPFEGGAGSGDDLFDQAVAVVARDRKASTSYIQRRLQIGYNRAATLIERMEDEGMIGPADHSGKREIFLPEREDV